MGKLNTGDYDNKRPKLEPSDLEGDAAILTIAHAEEIEVNDPERAAGFRKALVLQFEESEEKAMWPNASQTQTLILMLGDDTDEWIGKVIPVEAKDVRWGGKTHHKVAIMEPRFWEDAFEQAQLKYPYKRFAASSGEAKVLAPKPTRGKTVKRNRR